ncbi:MAG: hypothetical protein JWM11_7189 [Planctomycetaceae bacterium]|nr:hypothetical protein [Planctomycetaceae bacterium]
MIVAIFIRPPQFYSHFSSNRSRHTMPSPELTLSLFLRLAVVSHERGQMLPRNKFLILAGAAACTAAWLPVAVRCRELVLGNNAAHMLHRFETFPDALRSGEFQVYLKQLGKFCSIERAEHLLDSQGVDSAVLSEADAIQILDQLA